MISVKQKSSLLNSTEEGKIKTIIIIIKSKINKYTIRNIFFWIRDITEM